MYVFKIQCVLTCRSGIQRHISEYDWIRMDAILDGHIKLHVRAASLLITQSTDKRRKKSKTRRIYN